MRRQIAYAATRGLPWGISESAYNARDLELTYQYSNFGVPGLGLKRGLGDERGRRALCDGAGGDGRSAWPHRTTSHASPTAGARGRYGFYEALDYTPSRLPAEPAVAIVRAFMAHHQGMTIVAIADTLLDGIMRDAVPCRTDRPGDRTAAAGAHAARCRRRAPLGVRCDVRRRGAGGWSGPAAGG